MTPPSLPSARVIPKCQVFQPGKIIADEFSRPGPSLIPDSLDHARRRFYEATFLITVLELNSRARQLYSSINRRGSSPIARGILGFILSGIRRIGIESHRINWHFTGASWIRCLKWLIAFRHFTSRNYNISSVYVPMASNFALESLVHDTTHMTFFPSLFFSCIATGLP